MDIKHVLSRNPLTGLPPGRCQRRRQRTPPKAGWLEHDGGPVEIGHRGSGFGFDNEFPVHTVHLTPFALADRPVTCGEWLSFMEDDGYRRPEFWLSDGWAVVNARALGGPALLVTRPDDPDRWLQFTLAGLRPVDPDEPVCHVSYYEADAFAHWTGMRLPTEAEWETVAAHDGEGDNFLRDDVLDDRRAAPRAGGRVERDVRRRLGVDLERLLALPGIPGRARGGRRVQRQVHGEPVRPARRLLRHAGRATSAPPIATSSHPARGGPSAASGWPGIPEPMAVHHRRPPLPRGGPQPDACRRPRGAAGRAQKSIPPVWFYDERGSRLFEEITQLPEYYPTRAERGAARAARRGHRRAVQGRHPRRARRRGLRQDPGPARRARRTPGTLARTSPST